MSRLLGLHIPNGGHTTKEIFGFHDTKYFIPATPATSSTVNCLRGRSHLSSRGDHGCSKLMEGYTMLRALYPTQWVGKGKFERG